MEVERTYGVTTQIEVPLIEFGATDYDKTPLSFASGDIRLHKYAAETGAPTTANAANTPQHVEKGVYRLVLTAAEMQFKRISIVIIDQTDPKTWEDQMIAITTYGNASAQHGFDRSQLISSLVTSIVNGVDDAVIETEGSVTRQQAESIVLAALAGVTTDQGATLKDPSGNESRIVATLNALNERTGVTLIPSA